jgi:hypothetical protein
VECTGQISGFCPAFSGIAAPPAGHRSLGRLAKIAEPGADGGILTTQPIATTDTTGGFSIVRSKRCVPNSSLPGCE